MTKNLAKMLCDLIADPDTPEPIKECARKELVDAATAEKTTVIREYRDYYYPRQRWRDLGVWSSLSKYESQYKGDEGCKAFLAAMQPQAQLSAQ